MITAQEARNLTNQSNEYHHVEAVKWATSKLEYLENVILRAIERGNYQTEYEWHKEELAESGLTQGDAKTALTEVLSALGYQTEYCFNYGSNGKVFKIYIYWEEGVDATNE